MANELHAIYRTWRDSKRKMCWFYNDAILWKQLFRLYFITLQHAKRSFFFSNECKILNYWLLINLCICRLQTSYSNTSAKWLCFHQSLFLANDQRFDQDKSNKGDFTMRWHLSSRCQFDTLFLLSSIELETFGTFPPVFVVSIFTSDVHVEQCTFIEFIVIR